MRVWGSKKKGHRLSSLLLIFAFAISACGKIPDFQNITTQSGFTPSPDGGSNSKVDILFVIDTSGSATAQATLGSSFETFIEAFTDKDLQYQIGITSTDTCNFDGTVCNSSNFSHYWDPSKPYSLSGYVFGARYPGVFNNGFGGLMSRYETDGTVHLDSTTVPASYTPLKYLTWNMTDSSDPLKSSKQVAVDRFTNNISIGGGGSASEAPIAAATAAIDRTRVPITTANLIDLNYNDGFFRPGAFTVIIMVTDEDESFGWLSNTTAYPASTYVRNGSGTEQSDRVNDFLDTLEDLKGGNLDNFVLGVVARDPSASGLGCATSTGDTLKYLVNTINSTYGTLGSGKDKARFYDICSTFGNDLATLATEVVEANARYALDQTPADTDSDSSIDGDDIIVKVNGTTISYNATNGWQYDSVNNVIQFYGSAVPSASDTVSINYTPL